MTTYFFTLLLIVFLRDDSEHQFVPFTERAECVSCHADLLKNDVVHPELESTCDICHTSTGAEHPVKNTKGFVLTEKLPVLCFNCHSELQGNIDKSPIIHGPLKDSLSCILCHKPHSSSQQRLLIDGTNDLCLNCHDKTIKNGTTTISNIKKGIVSAKSLHPAIESGCAICHNPHYSENRALLTAKFPKDQYIKPSPDSLELCFMCHDSGLLETNETETATNFRNGKTNLHFIHVNREKGRNCTMCHDVHSAANDRLVLDKVKFGNWEMPIKFNLTDNGGSCLTACHSERNTTGQIILTNLP